MKQAPASCRNVHKVVFDCPLTFEHRQQLEDTIISAMRRHRELETDLSGVQEIDLFGIHLLGLLRNISTIIAISPAIEQAAIELRNSRRGTNMERATRWYDQLLEQRAA